MKETEDSVPDIFIGIHDREGIMEKLMEMLLRGNT